MTIRDREVVELLHDEPELLAIADAVVETQRLRRPIRPWGAVTVAALAAALFLLVLASPWDRGGGSVSVLDRALAAIETRGPVVHMTIRFEESEAGRTFAPVTTESFYDKKRRLVRVVSRSDGRVLADYTTKASEDEFVLFPGLLDGAEFYRHALSAGDARIVGEGTFQGRSVYWVELEGGGGPGIFQTGIDRESYRPVVFRALDPDGTQAGFQVAVLGFEYVTSADASFQPEAPVLVSGRVLDPGCRPIRARVGASLAPKPGRAQGQVSAEIASARSGPDGRFTLRVDPAKSPFRHRSGRFDFNLFAQAGDPLRRFGFASFTRVARDGRWLAGAPLTITVGRDRIPLCN